MLRKFVLVILFLVCVLTLLIEWYWVTGVLFACFCVYGIATGRHTDEPDDRYDPAMGMYDHGTGEYISGNRPPSAEPIDIPRPFD